MLRRSVEGLVKIDGVDKVGRQSWSAVGDAAPRLRLFASKPIALSKGTRLDTDSVTLTVEGIEHSYGTKIAQGRSQRLLNQQRILQGQVRSTATTTAPRHPRYIFVESLRRSSLRLLVTHNLEEPDVSELMQTS